MSKRAQIGSDKESNRHSRILKDKVGKVEHGAQPVAEARGLGHTWSLCKCSPTYYLRSAYQNTKETLEDLDTHSFASRCAVVLIPKMEEEFSVVLSRNWTLMEH